MHRLIYTFFLLLSIGWANSQDLSITGTVLSDDQPLEFATVSLNEKKITYTDQEGRFVFNQLENGKYSIQLSYLGYIAHEEIIELGSENIDIQTTLKREPLNFDEIVVTGTKTFKRQTNSAVIVNVVDSKTLDNIQACNLSEGLKFQPGLRVETDCQTCNYTQLRMNGLAGGYSQILINGRPIFSPLTGLYGLEQIPVNMIDKIEVIRGGGSSLYGSSAIGGTVNILTKIPQENSITLNSMYQRINSQSNDMMLNGNGNWVTKKKNAGISLFMNQRNREIYDHNNDGFSELPKITNSSVGISTFFKPTDQQKIEVSLSRLYEYRYGGEITDLPAHLAMQSEERTHRVWMGSADYQINFSRASLILYSAFQNTSRDHYTGIFPDDPSEISQHLDNPPYGISNTSTLQSGLQFNYEFEDFMAGSNIFTLGAEYLLDDTYDEIPAYQYLIDQVTRDLGIFVQSDYEISPYLNLLTGVRMDHHNLVDPLIFSPRISLLYKFLQFGQVRLGYGTGFRAPQAFDTDLHIAFAGGGVSRVQLDPELKEERSESFNLSVNYDQPTENWIAGFTTEAFYTRLDDAFILKPIGEDEFGEQFRKENGQGATVQGLTLELRANYNRVLQLESGFTIQSSRFDQEVVYIDELEGLRAFIRTPDEYGFANLSFTPNNKFNFNLNYVYTGSMIIPHFAGAPNQDKDELFTTSPFSDLSSRIGYLFPLSQNISMELYGGVKNVLNSYQEQFDTGKNRDSNFVYGPSAPRSLYVGVKLML
ncbi:TonB-dependent receptor [Portibacter marinus]|uniref:TonB-dependent receptor n=1 Tax=Portibacter marinus TaxID=2898660 RepID=UPI001F15D6B2|nr:TonB-dependent receptor [Portibacter marinus]